MLLFNSVSDVTSLCFCESSTWIFYHVLHFVDIPFNEIVAHEKLDVMNKNYAEISRTVTGKESLT